MIHNYNTGKLPLHFTIFGVMLLAIAMWRIIVLDWFGVLFLIISLLLLCFKSGLEIDSNKQRFRKYIGCFFLRKGEWIDVDSVNKLQIVKTKEVQTMNVLTLGRTTVNDVYKLRLNLSYKVVELMSEEKKNTILVKA